MSAPSLPPALLSAGGEYYAELRKLGLRPEGALWVYELADERFHLWVIWSGIDKVGPLAVSRLLFRAYNHSILPQAIDPFRVTVLSPNQLVGRATVELLDSLFRPLPSWMRLRRNVSGVDATDPSDEGVIAKFHRDWIYERPTRRKTEIQAMRDWSRFEGNVTRLAA